MVAVCGSRVLALLIVFFLFYTHRYFNKYVGEVVWDVASQTPFLHLTWKSGVDLLFPTDGFPVDLWPTANHLLILSSALNGTLNVYF